MIKMSLGISKYSRSTPLLDALEIRRISELYQTYKIQFLEQVTRNGKCLKVFEELLVVNQGMKKTGDSFFSQIARLSNLLGYDVFNTSKDKVKSDIRKRFECLNLGLLDSLRMVFSGWRYDLGGRDLLAMLLRVGFGAEGRRAFPSGLGSDDLTAVGEFMAQLGVNSSEKT